MILSPGFKNRYQISRTYHCYALNKFLTIKYNDNMPMMYQVVFFHFRVVPVLLAAEVTVENIGRLGCPVPFLLLLKNYNFHSLQELGLGLL